MSRINTQSRYLYYIAAFLIFLDMMPYFWWWTQANQLIQYFFQIVLLFIFGLFFDKKNRDQGLIMLFVIIAVVYSLKITLSSLVLTIPLLFIPFASRVFISKVFNAFSNIYCVIIGLSLIAWVLLMIGLISPIGTVAPLNANDFEYYTKYPLFLVTSNNFDIQNSFRFAGPFDEPGVIGTFSALLLFVNSFNFKDWRTYILLLSGICSFSLFFILIVGIGLISSIKKINSKVLLVVLVSIIGILFIYDKTKDDVVISRIIWDRLEWNSEEKGLSGFDRTNYEAERIYESKKGTIEYWFGLRDYERYKEIARGSNSYQNVVMRNGMFFLMLYVFFFMLYAWNKKRNRKSFIVFVIVLLSCIYQRPQVLSCAYVFLYCCIARNDYFQLNINKDNRKKDGILFNSGDDTYLQTI